MIGLGLDIHTSIDLHVVECASDEAASLLCMHQLKGFVASEVNVSFYWTDLMLLHFPRIAF